jgi:hypothetical protein
MKKKNVPQDPGIIENYGHELCYAVDNEGKYTLVPSIGWEPKNIANKQAWQVIDQEIELALGQINKGRKSPIAYYMAKHQMDIGLLANYMGLYRWQVKRHLKPAVFKRLKEKTLKAYADLFDLCVSELGSALPHNSQSTGK